MTRLTLLTLFILCFSCSSPTAPIQGKLEDFVSGEMSFERDIDTGFMGFRGAVEYKEKEVAYTEWNGQFKFFDLKTGRRVGSFEIPKEGPMSLKGGPHVTKAFNESVILATNTTGNLNIYKNSSLEKSFKLDMSEMESSTFFSFPMSGNALHQIAPDQYELSFNPFDAMAHRMGKDGFDIDFSTWILKFDESGNMLCKTDFKAPYDKSYANSSLASSMVRLVENGDSWAMFSLSDSLYQIKDCKIIQRIKLESITPLTYLPDKYEGDRNKGTWKLPETGAMNARLAHDLSTGLNIRLALLKHRELDPEISDPRKRMFLDENTYLLLIYDADWNLLGELEILYPSGTKFENLFSTSEGLFLNKPEQKSEDEYEFYKIDLSRFTD